MKTTGEKTTRRIDLTSVIKFGRDAVIGGVGVAMATGLAGCDSADAHRNSTPADTRGGTTPAATAPATAGETKPVSSTETKVAVGEMSPANTALHGAMTGFVDFALRPDSGNSVTITFSENPVAPGKFTCNVDTNDVKGLAYASTITYDGVKDGTGLSQPSQLQACKAGTLTSVDVTNRNKFGPNNPSRAVLVLNTGPDGKVVVAASTMSGTGNVIKSDDGTNEKASTDVYGNGIKPFFAELGVQV